MARARWYVLGSLLVGYGALQVLGRQAGSTAEERRMRMPGDEVVSQPRILTNHAITIEAPPTDVWPWLSQMGWHLGGYYTPEWVDRLLFRQNWPSLDHLDPALLRDLDVGDIIPDGPSGTAEFVVREVDAPHTLVLHSTTHLPQAWREKFGADIDWTWSFRLAERPGGRTRLRFVELLAHRAGNPPSSSSLAEEERLCSLLLRSAARDTRRSQLCGSAVEPRRDA
jgi:hypothetical protein